MIDKKQFFAGLLASLLLASTALPAQEVAKEEVQKAEESATEEQAETSKQQKPDVERNETFVPSENISSDNSISFPVDI